jgi:hypothetical protein
MTFSANLIFMKMSEAKRLNFSERVSLPVLITLKERELKALYSLISFSTYSTALPFWQESVEESIEHFYSLPVLNSLRRELPKRELYLIVSSLNRVV